MKKILLALLAVFTLGACSSGETNVSSTCTMEDSSGVKMSMTVTAPSEDANVEELTMLVSADYETMGLTADMVELFDKDELSQLMEDSIITSLGGDESGVEVTRSEFTDTAMEIEMKMDVAALMEQSGSTEDTTVASFVEYMEQSGATCQ